LPKKQYSSFLVHSELSIIKSVTSIIFKYDFKRGGLILFCYGIDGKITTGLCYNSNTRLLKTIEQKNPKTYACMAYDINVIKITVWIYQIM